MTYKEEIRDLFSVPNDYYLAHCISSDFVMGKGIAIEFVKRFDMRNKLISQYTQYDWEYQGYCLIHGKVFNLVTKEFYYDKPTYKTLTDALWNMRDYVVRYDIKKIAMPVIGCGLDRLEWCKVSEIIKEVFEDTDVEILICKQK